MNKGIMVAISSILVGALLIWKWEVIKKLLAPKQPPVVDPSNTGTNNGGQNTNPTGGSGTGTSTSSPNGGDTPPPSTTTDLDKLFVSAKSNENRLAQLILQAIKVKQKLTIADINADGQFGAKSVAAFDAIFPYQRFAKPFNLRTLRTIAKEIYGIETDANANIVVPYFDETKAKVEQWWRDKFLPK